MRSLKSGLVTIAVSSALGLAAVVGCSADGASDVTDPTSDSNPTEGDTAKLPPPSNTGDTTPPPAQDAGKPKSDGGSKKTDAGVDAGPPPPSPGSTCTKVDDIATKDCGKCGQASALCQTDKTWSQYGACENEQGECVPGATQPCGNCGTQTCDQFCGWGACTGEPANSCSPGTSEQSTVGCPASGAVKPYRTRSCKADCTWDNFSQQCFTPPTFAPIPLELKSTATIGRLSTGNCPVSSVSSTVTPYVYTPVTNPSAAPVKVTLYHSAVTGGPANIDTVLGVYNGATPPADDAARKACVGTVGDQSYNDMTLTGDSNWAIVKDITIPANGTITVYSAAYSSGTGSTGKFQLNIVAQ